MSQKLLKLKMTSKLSVYSVSPYHLLSGKSIPEKVRAVLTECLRGDKRKATLSFSSRWADVYVPADVRHIYKERKKHDNCFISAPVRETRWVTLSSVSASIYSHFVERKHFKNELQLTR